MPASATAGMSVGLTMNKFYTAYTFIESPAAPITKGTVLTLNAKAGTDSAPTSYRVLAGPDGTISSPLDQSMPTDTSARPTPSPTSRPPEMCRYAKIGTNTRFGDYSPTNVHPSVNPTDEPPDLITQENISYAAIHGHAGQRHGPKRAGREESSGLHGPDRFELHLQHHFADSHFKSPGRCFIRKKMATVPNTASCTMELEYIGAPLAVPEGTYSPGSRG